MVVTITEGHYSDEHRARTEAFLAEFLPRMKQQPGVLEILHYADPETHTSTTVTLWESEADVRHYRESELIKEAIAFEKQTGEAARRAGPFDVQRYG
jgi:heme-degrading monooxygenase HmoA